MESDLILSEQSAYPEPDNFTAEEPYLEAKLYIERVEQENRCQEENHDPLATDGPELLEHGVSITMYPVRVPSMHFSCATVQWDMPQTPADAPSQDSGSSEINSSYGLSMDWVVNPLDVPLLCQEEIIDLVLDDEPGQTEDDLQQGPAINIEVNSCQLYDAHTEVQFFGTPSNEDDQTPFTETSQMSEVSDDGGLVDYEKNNDEIESHLCIENPEIQLVPEGLEVLEEESVKTENNVLLTESEQGLGDVGETKEAGELNTEDDISVIIMTPCVEDCSTTPQSETNDPVLELDSKQSEEPGLIQESDPPQPVVPPDLVCNAVEAVETEDSENVELIIIANDETLELENAETFLEMQESVLEVKQEEPTCEEQIEITVEVELHECKEQLIQQLECSDEVENSKQEQEQEESKQGLLLGEEPSEGSKQSSSNETETSDQASQTKSTDDIEASQAESPNATEHWDESERSTETDTSQVSESKDSKETNQPNELQQTEQEDHTNCEQHQNHDIDSVRETEEVSSKHVHVAEEQQEESVEPVIPYKNGNVEVVDREEACKLAERLYKLDNVQRTDVVRHLDKDNAFSRAVGEEYLKFFDFTGQSLDEALRSFLKEVVLIGETQERERVLDHFSRRYQQCNPETFSSPGAVLTLTCAVMLLNTDLHGQNVGKAMSLTVFVSNLDGMNEGENFSKDLLKSLYNSIKNHQLEWAVEEKELLNSITLEQDSDQDASLRSKSNPFQDLAHDKKATVFQKGFLKRKAHADIDGKRTPWGKRSWKTFYAVLKGMVLYLQKDEYRKDWQSSEEVLSVHHALAERAQDYTKRPHVFRLQTADWRVFLFEAQSTEQMNSWIGRINLVSALYSSPPFPAAVGSQRKFCRPILPATQSTLTLEKQLQSHAAMLQSFQEDLSALQQGAQESRRAKAREVEEHRQKEEYLQHERSRYEAYVHILDVWQTLGKSSETVGGTDLALFDQELWKGADIEEKEDSDVDGGMKRSHSSPSLELEVATPPVVKVRRNISERRTYRKIVIPRRNREV
ncbi:PH and SEC7 domain-containing protein 4 [Pangasianodon hypophthalmus]|uniref:PH and SEC7 domain-containing protein 4 n=1 Tax=Pangasianodon hypophthalmus TaxID=310915 RepID=UPI002307D93E|nr:PH and SEC7 domain-containing protein 4 [Pangasianodon hypophthalmus]